NRANFPLCIKRPGLRAGHARTAPSTAPRERAVQPATPAHFAHCLPSPSAPSLERLIGEIIAATACLMARGLGEFAQASRMSPKTRQHGGEQCVLEQKA